MGSTHTNPDMADTYARIAQDPDRFYRGAIARDIAETVQHPPTLTRPRSAPAGR